MSKPTFSFHDEPVAWLYEPYLGPSLWGDHHDGMWGAPRLSFDQPYSTDRNITPLYARSMRLVPDPITGQSDAREFPPLPDAPGAEFAAASSAIARLTARAEQAERERDEARECADMERRVAKASNDMLAKVTKILGGDDADDPARLAQNRMDEIASYEEATETAERELDRLRDAIKAKGGDEHSPTWDAYERACRAIDKHRACAETAERDLAKMTENRDAWRDTANEWAKFVATALAQEDAPSWLATCPSCGGHGHIWTGEDVKVCPECKGNTVVPAQEDTP